MAEAQPQDSSGTPLVRTAISVRIADYLKRPRTRTIFGCFLASSILLAVFSGIDLRVSSLFFDHGFQMAERAWTRLLHHSVGGFIVVSMLVVIAIHAVNRLFKRNQSGVDGRKVAYLFLVLILGAGLIVNVALKDNFGRARPRDIEEFGGSHQFTPAFVMTDACDRNCSFASGDSAGAFFALAFILVSGRRRAITTTGVGYGVLVSVSRIASGAHFLSDTIVSFFVMLIVADFLHYLMYASGAASAENASSCDPGLLTRSTAASPVLP